MPFHKRQRGRRWPEVVALLAALACSAPALAIEQSRVEPVWIESLAPDGDGVHTISALLSLPPGWMVGDAAALLLSDGPWPGTARERLVAALLGEQAAVLEFDMRAARRLGMEDARVGPEPTAVELALDVGAAVEVLRRETGAGLVVALGHGVGGDAALAAASLERSAPEPDRAGLVAAASLGPGSWRVALGGAAPGRGWPVRAERLCAVLAWAALPAEGLRSDEECRRALAGPGKAYAVRATAP